MAQAMATIAVVAEAATAWGEGRGDDYVALVDEAFAALVAGVGG